ncbi:hypothetical protein [Pectobacterium brasiliense]|uniref:hypothetical protein n=1 Tax=Pectobacterium brasiliense TaxID=180957 RepID=UPI003873A039
MDAATINTLNTTVTIVGFIATIASLILAVGAIWLSIVFYKMSDEASKETTSAAKDIQASVERLENIFDKLYSDTFSMMRDTVTDMRQHIWRKPEQSNQVSAIEDEDKIKELKNSISQEIISIIDEKFKNMGKNDGKIREIEDSVKTILESKLSNSLNNNKTPEIIMKQRILSFIERHGAVKVDKLIKMMCDRYIPEVNSREVMPVLFELRESDVITWDGPANEISSNNIVIFKGNIKNNKDS